MPKRIQRSRSKGWKMPEGVVYVGRPGKWGNPFRVLSIPTHGICVVITQGHLTRVLDTHCKSKADAIQKAIERYEVYAKDFNFDSLVGKDLACWCPLDQLCHADVLLRFAMVRAFAADANR